MESGYFRCFRCGAWGFASRDQAGEWRTREVVKSDPLPVRVPAPEGFYYLCEGDGATASALDPAREFLRRRGLPEATWAAARLGACISGRYQGRVVVPVFDDDGEIWRGWVGRAWIKKAEVPYLYPEGMSRADLLYNGGALALETDEPALVVEGVLDALCPGCHPDGVALLGKPSEPQVEQLIAARRPVVVVLDGDAWCEGEMMMLRLRLEGQRSGSVKLPPTLDPDEVPPAALRRAARESLVAPDHVAVL